MFLLSPLSSSSLFATMCIREASYNGILIFEKIQLKFYLSYCIFFSRTLEAIFLHNFSIPWIINHNFIYTSLSAMLFKPFFLIPFTISFLFFSSFFSSSLHSKFMGTMKNICKIVWIRCEKRKKIHRLWRQTGPWK